ncbi:MAG: PspA/IM30 family protein [Myxococcota bacterium]
MSTTKPDAPRLLALTAAGSPVPPPFARLVDALRRAGAQVRPLPIPAGPPSSRQEVPPRLADLKAGLQTLADQVGAALRGDRTPGEQDAWLVSLLQAVEGDVDGVVATDPAVAETVFPVVESVWPKAVRVVVDGDFHVDPEWGRVPFDDLVTPHLALGRDVARVRERRGRLRAGGVLVGGDAVEPKRLEEEHPQVAVSFARLTPGDVDPLLFQLSLASPGDLSLLLLPSGREGVDELVRARAGTYGLRGKRPRSGRDLEPWIRGSTLLVGHPSPPESAAAVAAGVPQVLFVPGGEPTGGDGFLVQHGLATHCGSPVTVAVQLEALLPGGAGRHEAEEALAAFEVEGPEAAAVAVLEAMSAGRPTVEEALRPGPEEGDDELEDIGGEAVEPGARSRLGPRMRRAYLKEIILQQRDIDRQLARAKAGVETWSHRARLATNAGDVALAREARLRVEGLRRVEQRLEQRAREIEALRDRFAGKGPVSEADRAAASRFMSAETAASVEGVAPDEAAETFSRLELDDALQRLKDRMRR